MLLVLPLAPSSKQFFFIMQMLIVVFQLPILKDLLTKPNSAKYLALYTFEILVQLHQDAKKIVFTACHLGKLKLAFTSQDVISTSPKIFLTSRIDFTVLLLFEFLKKHPLPVGQVKNSIHKPNSKTL